MKRQKNQRVPHITITTGEVSDIPDFCNSQEAIALLNPPGEIVGGPISGRPGYRVTLEKSEGWASFIIFGPDDIAITINYVSWTSEGSNAAWRDAMRLHALSKEFAPRISGFDVAGAPNKPTSPKWLGTIVMPVPASEGSSLFWVANYEQCMAMALINPEQLAEFVNARCAKNSSDDDGPNVITIKNSGQNIVDTDYFGSEMEKMGKFVVSCSNGAIRMLWPRSRGSEIQEMMTGEEIIVTRGILQNNDGLEILFDDGSDSPYAIQMMGSSIAGSFPEDPGQGQWKLTVWEWVNGGLNMVLSKPTFWRKGTVLPDLRPRGRIV